MSSVLVYSTDTASVICATLAAQPRRTYVVCRTCGYEREAGIGCGLPCV